MQIVRDKNECILYVQMKENPQDFVIKINKLTHMFETTQKSRQSDSRYKSHKKLIKKFNL